MQAPVSVAKSNSSSGWIFVRAYVIASPSVSRPSASVLLISTVVPSIDVRTSPSL